MSTDAPNYHLRPNKAVDRNLFIETLLRLRRLLNLADYRYIGFGSFEFEDFKLVHRALGISDMHSIEMNEDVYRRQKFNKPYSFVKLFNTTCSDYFDSVFDEDHPSVIWIDFSSARNKVDQFKDISNICRKLRENDILRITLNSDPANIPLGKGHGDKSSMTRDEIYEHRFNYIKENYGDFFPKDSVKKTYNSKDIQGNGYPVLLLEIIRLIVFNNLRKDLTVCPICNYVYRDSTLMMTVTLLICAKEGAKKQKDEIRKSFEDWKSYVRIGFWKYLVFIKTPALTVHEQLEIWQLAEASRKYKDIEKKTGVNKDDIKNYLLFARYYPNYQRVII